MLQHWERGVALVAFFFLGLIDSVCLLGMFAIFSLFFLLFVSMQISVCCPSGSAATAIGQELQSLCPSATFNCELTLKQLLQADVVQQLISHKVLVASSSIMHASSPPPLSFTVNQHGRHLQPASQASSHCHVESSVEQIILVAVLSV